MRDPRTYAALEVLKDGTAVTVRALRDDDRARMAQAVRSLDRESIYLRLFSYRSELTEAGLDRIMRFDPDGEVALVATVGSDGRVIGGGRYVVDDPSASPRCAEIAFTVVEAYHGRGLAGRLLHHLAIIARERGIAAFTAEVLAGNAGMQRVFERSGLPITTRREDGVLHVRLALADAAR
jgi:RimJ/RimL family protein N-acetyltransferase